MSLFDNATSVIIDNKEVESIITSNGGVIYQKPSSGDNYALSLASDKNILSYHDQDSCTLTATLTNNNVPVSGESVTFKAYKGNTLVETVGSATTNSNGEATVSYVSKGTGDLNIKCEVVDRMLVSEIYSLEDCKYYSPTEYKQNVDSITLNIALPSTFQLEYDIKPTSRSTSNYGSGCYLRLGETSNNGVWAGQLTSAGKHGLMPKPSGITQYCTSNTVLSEDNHITVVFDGTTVTYTCNDETVSLSASNLSKINGVVPTSNNGLRNIKIKPL